MGATLAKIQISKEEAEETEEQHRIRVIKQTIYNSHHCDLIEYHEKVYLYEAYYQIRYTRITLGYYKTLEEAEKRLDDLSLKLFGEIENKHLIGI